MKAYNINHGAPCPCMGCADRTVGCHGKDGDGKPLCPGNRYAQWQEQVKPYRENRIREEAMNGYAYEAAERTRRGVSPQTRARRRTKE